MKGMTKESSMPGFRKIVDTYGLKASEGVDGLILHLQARASFLSVHVEGDTILVVHTYYIKALA